MIKPDACIAAYIAELTENAVVSRSHVTLRKLREQYGREYIDGLIQDYFKEVQQYDTRTGVAAAG